MNSKILIFLLSIVLSIIQLMFWWINSSSTHISYVGWWVTALHLWFYYDHQRGDFAQMQIRSNI